MFSLNVAFTRSGFNDSGKKLKQEPQDAACPQSPQ